ncbi:MAG TPA: hypothetical protein VGV36_09560 [Solirubrobacteraceae bacterium]|nr:hypothetical protein [Solirubrobacteraceae bacterium]
MRLHPLRVVLLALLAVALSPAGAMASGQDVIKDCTDDERIQGDYSQQEYNEALDELPTDADGYTPCRDVITRARDAAASGGRGGGGGEDRPASGGASPILGGSGGTPLPGDAGAPPATGDSFVDSLFDSTPEEQDALRQAQSAEEPAVIEGAPFRPQVTGRAPTVASISTLPTPVIALLVLTAAALAALGATLVRRRVLARRSA